MTLLPWDYLGKGCIRTFVLPIRLPFPPSVPYGCRMPYLRRLVLPEPRYPQGWGSPLSGFGLGRFVVVGT